MVILLNIKLDFDIYPYCSLEFAFRSPPPKEAGRCKFSVFPVCVDSEFQDHVALVDEAFQILIRGADSQSLKQKPCIPTRP